MSTGSGWFSDRSAAYLASGRPVITQNTGCGTWLPVGAGVLTFDDIDEAVGAIAEVNRRYDHHCHAARALAEEYFDAGRVLSSMLERALNPDSRRNEPATAPDPAAGAIES